MNDRRPDFDQQASDRLTGALFCDNSSSLNVGKAFQVLNVLRGQNDQATLLLSTNLSTNCEHTILNGVDSRQSVHLNAKDILGARDIQFDVQLPQAGRLFGALNRQHLFQGAEAMAEQVQAACRTMDAAVERARQALKDLQLKQAAAIQAVQATDRQHDVSGTAPGDENSDMAVDHPSMRHQSPMDAVPRPALAALNTAATGPGNAPQPSFQAAQNSRWAQVPSKRPYPQFSSPDKDPYPFTTAATQSRTTAASAAGGGGGYSRPRQVNDTNSSAHQAGGPATQNQGRRGRPGVARRGSDGGDDDIDDEPAAGAGAGGGGLPGFQTARQQLQKEMIKQGKNPNTVLGGNNGVYRQGLSKSKGGSNNSTRGFVPPYLSRAIDDMNNNSSQGGRGGGGGGNRGGGGGGGGNKDGDKSDSPFSERVMEVFAHVTDADGNLPDELLKHDPKIIEQVCHDILDTGSKVQWEDVAGLEVAKALLQEMIVWPMKNPQLFTGPRAPPRGLLLFGPPGTGKTMIGKAVASNISATFFAISASSLCSKWIGDGEKMVKALFAVANILAPSVIFIDEIDSILSARKSDGEHEASRRLKTEMLIQMEGCSTVGDKRVLLIGATNRPEELDEAARRRMPKQLYVPLPCAAARRQLVLRALGPGSAINVSISDTDLDKLVTRTEGYSGSDMKNLIQEACQGPVRDAAKRFGDQIMGLSAEDLRPVCLKDFQIAAKAQKASVHPEEIQRYIEWDKQHGAKYVNDAAKDNGGAQEEEEEDW